MDLLLFPVRSLREYVGGLMVLMLVRCVFLCYLNPFLVYEQKNTILFLREIIAKSGSSTVPRVATRALELKVSQPQLPFIEPGQF